jgi:hypothetical protein
VSGPTPTPPPAAEQSPVNQSTTQATGASASGMTGAAAVVLIWLLSLWKIEVPPAVAVAITALAGPFVHYAFVRITMKG